ncbi:hypothetical protein GCM10023115_07990 [Pontixanthobacter gangjinensis]|uniref:Uncharacterized protein n=1 Tax=Pontixanthobacter gangjinensis TaxID=1028742 RepID=A0A6I4SKR1_9SPHN|nr:hypothetical protein [Pontixanthobacter gangjinensis]MXO56048.1 hypothetical protein [Pontixanthobacter gangjinensis]
MAREIAETGLAEDVYASSLAETDRRPRQTSPSSEITSERALEIPADMLAQSYLITKTRLAVLAMVQDTDIEMVTPEGRIDQSNSGTFRQIFEHRLSVYRETIEQRGYPSDLAGEYSVQTVTSSCASSGSMLFAGASEAIFAKLTITQAGFEITLTGTVAANHAEGLREDFDLPFEGVVVEHSLAFTDFANSDLFYLGEVVEGTIEIRPDPAVLDSWPAWASPPRRKDLENCLLVLRRDQ